eukprot:959990-Alexandrium_andersonii.AAC.1
MSASLVGSEMCIRDRGWGLSEEFADAPIKSPAPCGAAQPGEAKPYYDEACLLYTSDAADDM